MKNIYNPYSQTIESGIKFIKDNTNKDSFNTGSYQTSNSFIKDIL